ncbi:MAG: triose-phosphate isomerase [Eubacteriales bacterium]|nr:triose-phosphate isomerase [Eubacteriales bacterium]
MRAPIIAGNWKMNNTPQQAVALIEELKPLLADAPCTVVVCPTFVCLGAAAQALCGSNIHLGAQNMHFKANGAYTGEVSADMLKALGVEYVILGHSERRQYFAETDETVNLKTKMALEHGLIPIVCVGESLQQREQGITAQLVRGQTKAALDGLTADEAQQVVIAYEPIWAIGTGRTATAQDANEVIGIIRGAVAELLGEDTAAALRIQYGGSMNPKNASELMAMPEIDGGLIGGASLKAGDFSAVVHF